MSFYTFFYACRSLVEAFYKESAIPSSHGFDHAEQVATHIVYAFTSEQDEKMENYELVAPMKGSFAWVRKFVASDQQRAILIAAFLHDVDDRKYFTHTDSRNAKALLKQFVEKGLLNEDLVPLVLQMIGLVSTSSNGSSIDETLPKWMYLPRDADRLEAIGEVGVKRCFEYTLEKTPPRPFWKDETELVLDDEHLKKMATKDRYDQYVKSGGKSACAIDHFYDKLFHVGVMSSGHSYMVKTAWARDQDMRTLLYKFNRVYQEQGLDEAMKQIHAFLGSFVSLSIWFDPTVT